MAKKLPVFPNLGPGARGPANASIGGDEKFIVGWKIASSLGQIAL
jgi:hypothetical protein